MYLTDEKTSAPDLAAGGRAGGRSNPEALLTQSDRLAAWWPRMVGIMDTTTLIIVIIVLVLIFGGGGFWYRGRGRR